MSDEMVRVSSPVAPPRCAKCQESVWVPEEITPTRDVRVLEIIMECLECRDQRVMRYRLVMEDSE